MKISTTTIECTADELRQSNSLSDAFVNNLRNAFNGVSLRNYGDFADDTDDEEDEK